MEQLKELGAPSEFWDYFHQISKIPRCSGKEEQIRIYIKNEAERLNYKTRMDKVGNLVINIPALINQKKLKIIFQCHMDMVCEKNENIHHDFLTNPLKLKIIEISDEKWLTAEGTTLGADNGVGIAYLLTLMKKMYNNELKFESIAFDLLFTVNEETGLTGAFQIDKNLIDGNYLINLDSEQDNCFTIGCAGGINTTGDLKFKYKNINNYVKNAFPLKLSVSNLIGGHSGSDIHRGRANGIKLIAKFLWKLNDKFSMYMNTINGGNRSNAIPREAMAIFYVLPEEYPEIISLINTIKAETEIGLSKIEPNMEIKLEKLETFHDNRIFPENIKNKLLNILYIMPNGPISMHPQKPNLVYTSTNLASIKTDNDGIRIISSQRSLHEISKQLIYEQIEALFKLADLDIIIQHEGDYPGWEPDFASTLLIKAQKTYKSIFKKQVTVQAIHAGLECGILKKRFPSIEMISIGPTIINAHSPDESLRIGSVEKIWRFIIELINNFIKE
jgi:dipeptidase D